MLLKAQYQRELGLVGKLSGVTERADIDLDVISLPGGDSCVENKSGRSAVVQNLTSLLLTTKAHNDFTCGRRGLNLQAVWRCRPDNLRPLIGGRCLRQAGPR